MITAVLPSSEIPPSQNGGDKTVETPHENVAEMMHSPVEAGESDDQRKEEEDGCERSSEDVVLNAL